MQGQSQTSRAGRLADHPPDLVEVEGLVQAQPAGAIQELPHLRVHRVAREEGDAAAELRVTAFQLAIERRPAELGRREVPEDHVVGQSLELLDGPPAVVGRVDLVAIVGQDPRQQLRDLGLVVHNEDGHGSLVRFMRMSPAARGSVRDTLSALAAAIRDARFLLTRADRSDHGLACHAIA